MGKNISQSICKAGLLFGIVLSIYSCRPYGGAGEALLEVAPADSILEQEPEMLVPIPIYTPPKAGDHIADTAKSYLGAREHEASNSGPEIDQFFHYCGVPPRNPWCACFVNYCVNSVGLPGPNAPAWSPSWFPNAKTIWKRGDGDIRFPKGSVFGIYFTSLKRVAHVGIVVEDFGDGYILTVEGNTNSAGSREGNGVFMRIRHKSQIHSLSQWH